MSTPTYHTLTPMFEELRGERVLVRPYRESDAQALFEAMIESREHLRPWMPFADEHQTVEESRDWIIQKMAHWLRASAEGYGYITEAIDLLTNYSLASLKANRLEIRCDELNVRSAAVPKRLGYVLEGRLRNHLATTDGRLRTTLVFSLIPTDRQ